MGLTVFLFIVVAVVSLIAWRLYQRLQKLERMRTHILCRLPDNVLREISNDLLLWTGMLINEHRNQIERAISKGASGTEIGRMEKIVREIEADFYETYDDQARFLYALRKNPEDILFKRNWEEYAERAQIELLRSKTRLSA